MGPPPGKKAVSAFWSKVGRQAHRDTIAALGFGNPIRVAIDAVIYIVALIALWWLGGQVVVASEVRVVGAVIIAALAIYVPIFVWNFVRAPALLEREAEESAQARYQAVATERDGLRAHLDHKQKLQTALVGLGQLRTQGVGLRNQNITPEFFDEWKKLANKWNDTILEEVEKISPPHAGVLRTLDLMPNMHFPNAVNNLHKMELTILSQRTKWLAYFIQEYSRQHDL